MARRVRQIRRTILLVVEGYTEKEFIQHLKNLYHKRGSGFRVVLKNAKGKGSNNVIDIAYGEKRQGGYDEIAVFYDRDVPLTHKSKRRCRNFREYVADPCLEGLFLEILEEIVADTCDENKKRYARFASRGDCGELFPRELLEKRRGSIGLLDDLLRLLEKGELAHQ